MPEEKREFRGIWIPKEVWLDTNLSAIEKIILAEINSLDGEDGCYASNAYLAKFCQCSESYVTKAISKLQKINYIKITSFDGRHRKISSSIVKFTRQSSKIYEADSEKEKGYNNNNNNNKYNNKKDYNKDNNSFGESADYAEYNSEAADEGQANNSRKTKPISKTKVLPEYELLFEKLWKLYPRKLGKQSVSIKTKKDILKIGYDIFAAAIQKYKDEIVRNGTEERYIKYGSTFFNTDYVDYLDDGTSTAETTASTHANADYDENGVRIRSC